MWGPASPGPDPPSKHYTGNLPSPILDMFKVDHHAAETISKPVVDIQLKCLLVQPILSAKVWLIVAIPVIEIPQDYSCTCEMKTKAPENLKVRSHGAAADAVF